MFSLTNFKKVCSNLLHCLLFIGAQAASDLVQACEVSSVASVANSYITPFGLVSSDTGNVQWVGSASCGNYGGYVEHVQRFNGGRDNTIVGVYYGMAVSDSLSLRVAVDHLDVDVPSLEVPRARLKVTYQSIVTVSAEVFQFMNGLDQRLLLWSVSDFYDVSEKGAVEWSVGGSFNTGFELADRYFFDIGYEQTITDNWSWKLRYNYQLQPMHNNLLQLDMKYRF